MCVQCGKLIYCDKVKDKKVCPNCGRWQHSPLWKGAFFDCYNDCALRGFAPRVKPESKALAVNDGAKRS